MMRTGYISKSGNDAGLNSCLYTHSENIADLKKKRQFWSKPDLMKIFHFRLYTCTGETGPGSFTAYTAYDVFLLHTSELFYYSM